ncbi:MAG: hypothetical protein U0R51_03185 [Solirubrobacterales bacterium]
MRSQRDTPSRAALLLIAAAAAILVSVLAGCGGGDDSDATTSSVPTGELSAAELASTADDLCAERAKVIPDAPAPDFGPDGPQSDEVKATAPYWEETAADSQDLLDQLSELQPPADLEKKYAEFLDLMKQGTVDFALELQKLAEAGDVKTFFRQAYKSQRELITLADSAQALGMKVCGAREVPQSSTGN